mgnify:CR=1 FL=1
MNEILVGIVDAIKLLISCDPEIYSIILLSMLVTFSSVLIASTLGIPTGLILGLKDFKGKDRLAKFLYTLMSLPPVVVGLVVALMISRKGPLGSLNLIFTPGAMIIAQTILVFPIITGIVFNSTVANGKDIAEIVLTLGGNNFEKIKLLITELRENILVAIITGFGRGISEVGAVMIVGGNIKNHTRVMTTYIAMNHSMGNYATSIAMGIVLLIISYLANNSLYKYMSR